MFGTAAEELLFGVLPALLRIFPSRDFGSSSHPWIKGVHIWDRSTYCLEERWGGGGGGCEGKNAVRDSSLTAPR